MIHTTVRAGVAVVCAATLAAASVQATAAASPVAAGQADRQTAVGAAGAAAQSLTFKVGANSLKVKGAAGLRAGKVDVKVTGKPKGHVTVLVAKLDAGYTVTEFRKDYAASNKGDMKALKRAIAEVDFLGGFVAGAKPGTGSLVLPGAGTYTAMTVGNKGPATPVVLRVGPRGGGKALKGDGTITARNNMRWGGDDHLPAKGRLVLKNAAKDAPHFLYLVQVVEGTTKDQVLESLQSDEQPTWMLEGSLETDVVSPGRSMAIDYDLPAGQYVALCFFPDPDMKGMPHAAMGMIKMVHVG